MPDRDLTPVRFGLYGKLPAKRDFVAVNAPRPLLAAVEPWLQGGLSASRVSLGAGWQAAFLRAPLWRFWLGAEVAGAPTLGAVMPSVDGIGRYFPLMLFCQADTLPPPESDPCEGWFPDVEDLLLSALEPGTSFEAVTGGLGRLPDPVAAATAAEPPSGLRPSRGAWIGPAQASGLSDAFAAVRRREGARLHAAMTYWWTEGGDAFAPAFVAGRSMPDPYLFTFMLTGRADDGDV